MGINFFFHPDYTVDSGIKPNHVRRLANSWVTTTDLDSHQSPKKYS